MCWTPAFAATRWGFAWAEGDFDGDLAVTFADYQFLEQNFGRQVPEPTILMFFLGVSLSGSISFRNRRLTKGPSAKGDHHERGR